MNTWSLYNKKVLKNWNSKFFFRKSKISWIISSLLSLIFIPIQNFYYYLSYCFLLNIFLWLIDFWFFDVFAISYFGLYLYNISNKSNDYFISFCTNYELSFFPFSLILPLNNFKRRINFIFVCVRYMVLTRYWIFRKSKLLIIHLILFTGLVWFMVYDLSFFF